MRLERRIITRLNSFMHQTTKRDIRLFSFLSIPRNFSFYFHFTHFPQKWINARKNASTPRTGGSLFSGIVEFRVLNLGRPRARARACTAIYHSVFRCSLSLLYLMSLSRLCHTCHHRPLPVL